MAFLFSMRCYYCSTGSTETRTCSWAPGFWAMNVVRSCRTVNDVQTRLTGYRVGYEYRGQLLTTFMAQNPGAQLQVRVSVDPVLQ